MMRKCNHSGSDFELTLLNYRNMPVAGLKYSSAQILMPRVLRFRVLCTTDVLKPNVVTDVNNRFAQNGEKVRNHYNKTANNTRY